MFYNHLMTFRIPTFQKQFTAVSIAALLLITADLVSKQIAFQFLQTPYQLFGSFFQLQYQQNFGIAFSLPLPYWLIIAVNIILLITIIYLADLELNLKHPAARFAVTFLIAGALGNFTDRLLGGYVIDFIEIWRWPAFNLADAYITVGVLLILLSYGKINKK
ncbi:MAG: signal peptidase II [Candidatus Gracilibacteria bacterium]